MTSRLAALANKTMTSAPKITFSVIGAEFQEWASIEAKSAKVELGRFIQDQIGALVTAINNNDTTVAQAKIDFTALLN